MSASGIRLSFGRAPRDLTADGCRRRRPGSDARQRHRSRASLQRHMDSRQPRSGPAIPQWQVQREAAALAGLAGEADLAAEQIGELAADGQPEPGAAEPAAGGHVGLLEGLEDDRLFVGGDADARVGHGEADDGVGLVERLAVALQPSVATLTAMLTLPRSVNLNAFESRFLSTCCSRAESVCIDRGKSGSSSTANARRLGSGRPVRRSAECRPPAASNDTSADVRGHHARLDLGQVQDVVDQRQQVVARTQDGGGELDLFRAQVVARRFPPAAPTG